MFRTLTAAAAVAVLCTLPLSPAFAQTAASAPKAKAKVVRKAAAKPAPAPAETTNDHLDPGQLSMADRVLTGVADCEFKEKVEVEKIPGHTGNFKVTYEKKSYIMVPEETTTGAIRLVDTGGAVVWIQIPVKSMLMNQKEHHRLVDDCQQDEQRIAVQAVQRAGANAAALAPSVAAPAAVAAASGAAAINAAVADTVAPGSTVTTTQTATVTTTTVVVPPPAKNGAAAPAAAASGMWK